MGSNFFSDDFFGWEEDDDENIRSAAEGAEGEPIVEFDDAQYWVDDTDDYQRTARQISRIIEIAINEEGLPIVGEILKTLQILEKCLSKVARASPLHFALACHVTSIRRHESQKIE